MKYETEFPECGNYGFLRSVSGWQLTQFSQNFNLLSPHSGQLKIVSPKIFNT